MGLFDSIMHKIFHAASASAEDIRPGDQTASAAPQASPPPAPAAAVAAQSAAPAGANQGGGPGSAAPSGTPVDVSAVLTQMAARKGGGGNWQSSIVDLLKLLDLDSSLSARKQLAEELNVHAGQDGSAEENIALHQAVMRKLADNGGVVPDNLKH